MLSSEALQCLQKLRTLEWLNLDGRPVNLSALDTLSGGLTRLTYISLDDCYGAGCAFSMPLACLSGPSGWVYYQTSECLRQRLVRGSDASVLLFGIDNVPMDMAIVSIIHALRLQLCVSTVHALVGAHAYAAGTQFDMHAVRNCKILDYLYSSWATGQTCERQVFEASWCCLRLSVSSTDAGLLCHCGMTGWHLRMLVTPPVRNN